MIMCWRALENTANLHSCVRSNKILIKVFMETPSPEFYFYNTVSNFRNKYLNINLIRCKFYLILAHRHVTIIYII